MLDREQISNWETQAKCPHCLGEGWVWDMDEHENVTKEDCVCVFVSVATPAQIQTKGGAA